MRYSPIGATSKLASLLKNAVRIEVCAGGVPQASVA
jgi:hypothetical protein